MRLVFCRNYFLQAVTPWPGGPGGAMAPLLLRPVGKLSMLSEIVRKNFVGKSFRFAGKVLPLPPPPPPKTLVPRRHCLQVTYISTGNTVLLMYLASLKLRTHQHYKKTNVLEARQVGKAPAMMAKERHVHLTPSLLLVHFLPLPTNL